MRKTWVMPRKTTEVERMTGTANHRMSKMEKNSGYLNRHLSRHQFYIARGETWTSVKTMRGSCISKSKLYVSSLRKT